jgi:cysteine desulfurase family protein (TIGR01976 family)
MPALSIGPFNRARYARTVRERFPGIHDGWARFDGPAGTQMVDRAIEAMTEHVAGGSSANSGGFFAASEITGSLTAQARLSVATLLGADPEGIVFGPNMTTLTFALTRAIARTLRPGDEILGTRLDHDANVTPWAMAANDVGASLVLAPFDTATGRLHPEAVIERITPRTRWVAITGASNALGTMPDLAPVVAAAHEAGARVFVDGVHLVPHRRVDLSVIGCDAFVTSAYKWYGPHAAVVWLSGELRDSLTPYKVRPAPHRAPERWETGTPSYEAIAGVDAAARFLLEQGMDRMAAAELQVFEPLLAGLLELGNVRVHGPTELVARTPTVCFSVSGHHPDKVAAELAARRIAVWSGSYYAVEVMAALGLGDGAVRAGVSRYTSAEDVERLLDAVGSLR